MSKKRIIFISVLIPLFIMIIYIITSLTSCLFNFLLIVLTPLILIFSIIWIIILLFKIRTLHLLVIPLILISLLPIFDIGFGFKLKIVESFKAELLLKAITETPISSSELYLRGENKFEFKNNSLLGTENYDGNYIVNKDTVILKFNNNKPDFIYEYSSK